MRKIMFFCVLMLLNCGKSRAQNQYNIEDESFDAENQEFLTAHNIRRKKFHEDYGVSYVPLKFSSGLKQQSIRWANYLAPKLCNEGVPIYHDPNNRYGENIAANWGSGVWANRPTPESILYRFVDRELNQPQKGHLTQALWRPSQYVGCAIAKATSGNKTCHVTVCRYAKPGNCNMGKFKTWQEATFQNDSPCGPVCPPEGCHLTEDE